MGKWKHRKMKYLVLHYEMNQNQRCENLQNGLGFFSKSDLLLLMLIYIWNNYFQAKEE